MATGTNPKKTEVLEFLKVYYQSLENNSNKSSSDVSDQGKGSEVTTSQPLILNTVSGNNTDIQGQVAKGKALEPSVKTNQKTSQLKKDLILFVLIMICIIISGIFI